MRKIIFGALLGAAIMYLVDPGRGGARRKRLTGLWAGQKETVLEAARTTAGAVSGVSQGVGSKLGDVLPGSSDSSNGHPEASDAGRIRQA